MEWKDCSSYSRGDMERIPSSWEYRINDIRICVHRHIHYPKDQWLLTCSPFYEKKELLNKDINKAKQEAIKMITTKLQKTIKLISC